MSTTPAEDRVISALDRLRAAIVVQDEVNDLPSPPSTAAMLRAANIEVDEAAREVASLYPALQALTLERDAMREGLTPPEPPQRLADKMVIGCECPRCDAALLAEPPPPFYDGSKSLGERLYAELTGAGLLMGRGAVLSIIEDALNSAIPEPWEVALSAPSPSADAESAARLDLTLLAAEEAARADLMRDLLTRAREYVIDALEGHEHTDGRDLLKEIDAAIGQRGSEPADGAIGRQALSVQAEPLPTAGGRE